MSIAPARAWTFAPCALHFRPGPRRLVMIAGGRLPVLRAADPSSGRPLFPFLRQGGLRSNPQPSRICWHSAPGRRLDPPRTSQGGAAPSSRSALPPRARASTLAPAANMTCATAGCRRRAPPPDAARLSRPAPTPAPSPARWLIAPRGRPLVPVTAGHS